MKTATEERPYADWLRAFCDRKYDSGFSREMTRSVEEYLSSFRGGGSSDP